MIFSKNIYFLAIMVVLAVFGFFAKASAQTVEEKPNDLMYLMIGNSVEGFWNLNIDESDDIRQKIQTLMQKSFVTPDKSLSTEQTETEGVSISILPPQRLVIAGGENEMTINEIYPDVISTRLYNRRANPLLPQQ